MKQLTKIYNLLDILCDRNIGKTLKNQHRAYFIKKHKSDLLSKNYF